MVRNSWLVGKIKANKQQWSKSGQPYEGKMMQKSPKSRKNYCNKWQLQSQLTNLKSPWNSLCQCLAFATIITWRARFASVKFWRRIALTMVYWLTESSASNESSWNGQVSNSKVKQLWKLVAADIERKQLWSEIIENTVNHNSWQKSWQFDKNHDSTAWFPWLGRSFYCPY